MDKRFFALLHSSSWKIIPSQEEWRDKLTSLLAGRATFGQLFTERYPGLDWIDAFLPNDYYPIGDVLIQMPNRYGEALYFFLDGHLSSLNSGENPKIAHDGDMRGRQYSDAPRVVGTLADLENQTLCSYEPPEAVVGHMYQSFESILQGWLREPSLHDDDRTWQPNLIEQRLFVRRFLFSIYTPDPLLLALSRRSEELPLFAHVEGLPTSHLRNCTSLQLSSTVYRWIDYVQRTMHTAEVDPVALPCLDET
jgi:hypothetical protein